MTASPLLAPYRPAILVLADGTVFHGRAIGAAGRAVGEVVFNTSMTGYQEILTDPSYKGQVVTLTYPHIGNVGVTREDVESARIHAAGLVVRDLPARASNWRADGDLGAYLADAGVVAIADLDTRRLTRRLREHGAQNGCIVAAAAIGQAFDSVGIAEAASFAREAPSMAGLDLAQVVSVDRPYDWQGSTWALGEGYRASPPATRQVVAFDYGVKHNILRMLTERGCARARGAGDDRRRATCSRASPTACSCRTVPATRSPATTRSARSATSSRPACRPSASASATSCSASRPARSTIKMKFGHHGANHPVLDCDTGQVLITSQNHGFAVDPATPAGERARDAPVAVRPLAAGHRAHRPARVRLPGPSGGEPGAAGHRLPVRPLREADGRPEGGRDAR